MEGRYRTCGGQRARDETRRSWAMSSCVHVAAQSDPTGKALSLLARIPNQVIQHQASTPSHCLSLPLSLHPSY